MRLYYSPAACSLAPHIVAREAGVPLDLVKVDLKAKVTEDGADFLAINPKGSVPALYLDAGDILTESVAIIQFIADMAPDAKLMPATGTFERYRALEWLNFVATELHKSFSPLWRSGTPNEMRAVIKNVLADKFTHLDQCLSTRSYLLGDGFAAPDAYTFTILSWGPHVGIELAQWPNLADYVQRISARPAVREAVAAEGLLEPCHA
jgi:glutathione S-transferase